MLAIRLTRTGRKGHAQFRMVVQDARLNPSSGRVVAALGSYDPHSKVAVLAKDKAVFYLEHGAQPSERAARLLKKEGVKLPEWVSMPADKSRSVRNPDKLRKNRPAESAPTEEKAVPEEAAAAAEPVQATPAETAAESPDEAVETAQPAEAADDSAIETPNETAATEITDNEPTETTEETQPVAEEPAK